MIFLILILIVIFSFAFSSKINGVYLTPLSIYTISFLLPSAINIFTDNPEVILADWLYLVIISAWFCFFIAYVLTMYFFGYCDSKIKIDNIICLESIFNKNFYTKTLFLTVISIFSTLICLYFVYTEFGFNFYSSGRDYELVFGKYSFINYIYYTNLLVIILSSVGIYLSKDHNRAYQFIRAISLLQCILNGQKSLIIIAILFSFYAKYLIQIKFKFSQFLYIFLSVVFIFFLVTLLRNSGDTESISFEYLFYIIESYITYNYKNLQNIIYYDYHDISGLPFVGYYDKFINVLSGNFNSISVYTDLYDTTYYLENEGFNVITYLGPLYKSYGGLFGIFFGTFIIGVSSSYFYFKFYKSPSIFLLILNVIFLTVISLSFSAFEFYRLQFWYIVLLTLLLF